MQLELRSPAKKLAACAALMTLAIAYLVATGKQAAAAHEAKFGDDLHLRRAAALDPGNAEYADLMGRQLLTAEQSPHAAVPWLTRATNLDPHSAKYWMDLGLAQQSLGDMEGEKDSLEHALTVDPRNPTVAWGAANLFLAQGSPERAMKLFHGVLENDPPLTEPVLDICWKVHPDIDYLLEQVVPAPAYEPFLEFLVAKKETAAAEKVWDNIFALHQPLKRRYLLTYMQYLIGNRKVEEASRVWQQATDLSDLASYQPSSENLLINGDFSLPILNGGFDWMHRDIEGVGLALDTSEPHSSNRSLRITFDGPGITEAGIMQLVPVDANTSYEFSALYKARDMDGAGGVEFAVKDAYTEKPLFMSEDLQDADFWKQTGGTFTTGPDTDLIMLQIARVPSGSPIRGKLWLDGLRLVRAGMDAPASAENTQ